MKTTEFYEKRGTEREFIQLLFTNLLCYRFFRNEEKQDKAPTLKKLNSSHVNN